MKQDLEESIDQFNYSENIATDANTKNLLIDNYGIRKVIHDNGIVSMFPFFKGKLYNKFKIDSITEWAHVDGVEAIVNCVYENGCALGFFAIDYATSSDLYKKGKDVEHEINLVGLAYFLKDTEDKFFENMTKISEQVSELTGNQIGLSQNFNCVFPGNAADEISFVGRIHDFKEYKLSDAEGYILSVSISGDLMIEMFVAKVNLETTLEVGKYIQGYVWLQGNLKKS